MSVLALAVPVVAAQDEGVVVGRPSLELSAPANRITTGETTLDVYLSNAGDLDRGGPEQFERRVRTARNVQLQVATDRLEGPLARALTVETGRVPAGIVPPGVAGPFTLSLFVADSLPPGTYDLPIEVTYEYTLMVRYSQTDAPVYVDGERRVVQTVPVVLPALPRVEVAASDQSLSAGSVSGYRFDVTNVGTAVATDVVLTFRTDNASVFFGSTDGHHGAVEAFVRRLEPNETVELALTTAVAFSTAPGTYHVDVTARYRTPTGREAVDRSAVGVVVTAFGGGAHWPLAGNVTELTTRVQRGPE